MQTQLIIPSLITMTSIAVAANGYSTEPSRNRVALFQNRLQPAKFEIQGGTQLTIRLKPTKQHPQIDPAARNHVQQVIKCRTNGLGIEDAEVRSIGNDLIIVRLPGVQNAHQAVRVLGATAQLEFREQKTGTEELLVAELAVLKVNRDRQSELKRSKSPDESAIAANQIAIDKQYTQIGKLFDKATISGKQLQNAVAQISSISSWEIEVEFDSVGSAEFAKLTKKIAGTGRTIGVFLDNDPISTPTVDARFAATGITGGKAVITGDFDAQTASDLAVQLQSGSLSVSIEIIDNRLVPPKQASPDPHKKRPPIELK